MSVQLKLRRGTTAQHSTFTGAEGEVTVDTTKDTIIVHDGVTPAGYPLAREDLSNVSPLATAKIADAAVTTAKIADSAVTSAKIVDGTIVTGDIADGAITSEKIADGTIVTADLADGAVTLPKLSASGTPSSANYLRGDGTWAAPASGGITSITAGSGLTGGTITGSGTIGLDFYTGTTAANTSYPIGSYLFMAVDSRGYPMPSVNNNVSAVYMYTSGVSYSGANKFFGNYAGDPRATVAGTWRSRGAGGVACASAYAGGLIQRVA